MSESLEANSKQMNDQIGEINLNEIERDQSNDFPGRPYMSVQEAIKSKDFEAIQPFIKSNGFNPNQQTMPQHKSILHELADSELTSSQTLQIAKELLDLGANPNLCDSKQETPLHIAVKRSQFDLASLLISCGANSTTSFNIDGNLPWYYADKLGNEADCNKMKDILRVGLEAFINQEEENNQNKKLITSSQSHDTYFETNNPEIKSSQGPVAEEPSRDMWRFDRGLTNSPFDGEEAKGSSVWPEAPDFSSFKDDDYFEPVDHGNSGSRINAIGAELKKNHNGGTLSPYDQSEDSDSKWEPASLWKGPDPYYQSIITQIRVADSKAYNSTEHLWKEKSDPDIEMDQIMKKHSSSRDGPKPPSQGIASVFNSALQGVRNDAQDRQSESSKYRKNYGGYGGNSAMDAVVQVQKDDDEKIDHDRKIKMKKLCDQYRGKFPRIDGISNFKEKSAAVLHFSAEQGFNMGISDALDAGVEVNSRRNGKSALLRTIVDGKRVNLDSARLLLRNGADADFQDANGNTFLHLAVSAAHVSAVDAVLRHNPSLELKNNAGATAWHLAQTKKGGGNVEIVKSLLIQAWKRYKNKRSEDKEEMDKRGDESSISNASTGSDKNILQRKSLISAANCGAQDQIKALLTDPNIDVNEQSAKGFSALHCAAGQGKIGIVRMLLNYNANPDLQTRDGFTALMLTGHSTRAWPEVADALLKAGANPNIRDMNGNTALHHASRNVHVRLVQLLCNRGADVSIRNKQGTQARGVKPWDGKRGWNLTPERWSQETKDSVRDIKNILQEAFNKQKVKKELDGNKGLDGNNGTRGIGEPPKDTKTINDLDRLVTTSTTKRMTMIGGNDKSDSARATPTSGMTPINHNRPFNNYNDNDIKIQNEDSPSLIPRNVITYYVIPITSFL